MNKERKSNIVSKLGVLIRARLFAFFVVLFLLFGCTAKEPAQPPNIVFILADDLGTEVLGCYGGTTYYTPNIDNLAETGMRFNHCYSSPVCSPSRVNLLTGRYGFRTGQKWGHLPKDEITFAHILSDAGYETAIAGKWQMELLKDNPDHIAESGFDESCVFGWHETPRYYEPMIYQNGEVLEGVKEEYGPDVYSQFLIDFIRNNKDGRFLAYYSMALAHEVSNDFETPPPKGPSGKYKSYKELVEYGDKLIGRFVETLDKLGLRENTLILFSGDNGTPYHFITKYENGEYIRKPVYSAIGDSVIRGGKSFMTDAGTHVPLIANWAGVTEPGSVNNSLIDFSDFLPTFAELADAELPEDKIIDGRSFLPQLTGKDMEGRDWVYVTWEGESWIRNQRWKLYDNGELYDMKNDPKETEPVFPREDSEKTEEIREYLRNEMHDLKTSGK
jgi:arylsulfatase A